MVEYAITTVDNPYDPFEQFQLWFTYDVLHQHNTCDRLAKAAMVTDLLSDPEKDQEIERAIDEIIANDPENKYRKVRHSGDSTRAPRGEGVS